MAIRETARQNLGIASDKRILLSFDGGGMRGIFTVQMLKKLEELAGAPIYQWADMVAGTSTGAIIAGLVSAGKSAAEIEDLYIKLVSRVFTSRGMLASRFMNPPAFDKKNYRKLLKEIVGDKTLKDCNALTGLDMMFTSKDMAAGEEAFFTCFNVNGNVEGTYQNILLRAAMEATMSAPTYFAPFERFVDGGTTTFNNPVAAAVLEALTYNGKNKYQKEKLVVFSFGTATVLRFVDAQKTSNPKGLDTAFWLNYVMAEVSKDASEMQVDMLRSGLLPGIDFRRYQLSLDTRAVQQLPDLKIDHIPHVEADWLHQLTDKDLGDIDMADVSKFSLMKTLGEAMAQYICPPDEAGKPMDQRRGNWFQRDMIDPVTKRGVLVTAHGNVEANKSHLGNVEWVDSQPTA